MGYTKRLKQIRTKKDKPIDPNYKFDKLAPLKPLERNFVMLLAENCGRDLGKCYLGAGYRCKEEFAGQLASTKWKDAKIRAAYDYLMKRKTEREGLKKDDVIGPAKELSTSSIEGIASWKDGKISVTDSSELTSAQLRCIQGIRVRNGEIVDVKVRDPMPALTLLADILGLRRALIEIKANIAVENLLIEVAKQFPDAGKFIQDRITVLREASESGDGDVLEIEKIA